MITSLDELATLYGLPSGAAVWKEIDHINAQYRAFIEASPFFVLASVGPEGVDVSPDALAFCRRRGLQNVRLGEAERLPYEDGSFDLVTGLDVVEHLDDDLAGLREMRRVLRPGGYAFLFVPAFMFLWGVQDDISHHRRRYTLRGLQQTVAAAGFAARVLSENG